MFSVEEKVYAASTAIAFKNLHESMRQFKVHFKKKALSVSQIKRWKMKLLKTGSLVKNQAGAGKPKTATDNLMTKNVVNIVNSNPQISQRSISRHLEVSLSSVNRILKNEGYFPFKYSIHQQLRNGDQVKRENFCEKMIKLFEKTPQIKRNTV